jgi:transcriptional regulator with XRE-family HTH domain
MLDQSANKKARGGGNIMTDQLKEIGMRLTALREICGYTKQRLADACGIRARELEEYERGEKDFSFSFLYNAANALNVDVLDIMSGDSPKLSTISYVKAGGGFEIKRREAYSYKHLAFTFKNKRAEPFMVTVEPNVAVPVLHAHVGQVFNYMVEGRMRFFMDSIAYELSEGDSIYFDSSVPHAMQAVDGKRARFLAVVMK